MSTTNKIIKVICDKSDLTAIADSVRGKTGITNKMTLSEINNEIQNFSNGLDTSDATAAADEIFLDKTAYVNGKKETGTFTIDSELSEQDELIAQILALLADKATYNTIYIGTTAPTDDFGVDGDIYIVRGSAT